MNQEELFDQMMAVGDETVDNIVNIKSTEEENGNISIQSDSDYFKEMYYFTDIFNEKEYKKFIKNVELLIRKSKEYTGYIKTLKEEYPMMKIDNILSNISDSDASIELHHYPFTLYDVVDVVAIHSINKGKQINTNRLAKLIMEMHYENIIGLVPMTSTIHELAHQGHLFLAKDQIFGNWSEFVDRYKEVLTDEMKYKLKQIEEMSEKNVKSDFNDILR